MSFEPGLYIDKKSRKVWVDGHERPDPLSKRELNIMKYLASHHGNVCTREATLRVIEGTEYNPETDGQRFDAMIERLRRKIGDTERPWRFLITDHRRGHHLEGVVRGLD